MEPEATPAALRPQEVFSLCVAAYANLRGYLADRYGDTDPDVAGWLAERGVTWVEGVPEADELTEMWAAARQGDRCSGGVVAPAG